MQGHVKAGECVLIPAGGQVVIAICLHTDCNVITAVSNKEEYKHVKSLC